MAKKTSVQFYYDYIEQLEDLTDKQFRDVVTAMVNYDENDNVIKLDQICKMAFSFIKKRIDYDKDRYRNICERNKLNGSKGGRPRNPKEPKKPNGLFGNPKKPKKPDIDIDIELDKDIDITTTNTIYDYIEENFGRTLSPVEYEDVSRWEDNELTRYAIKQAILNGAYNMKYIKSILNSYKKNNITTVQQAQEEETRFRESKNKPKNYGKYQSIEEFNAILEKGLENEEE